jgi:hypothetical protein
MSGFPDLDEEQKANAKIIYELAKKHGVPPRQALAQAFIESSLRNVGTNEKGATGIMQVRQDATTDVNDAFGTNFDASNPAHSAEIGILYSKLKHDQHNPWGDTPKNAARAYNEGSAGFLSGRTNPETENYVMRLTELGAFDPDVAPPKVEVAAPPQTSPPPAKSADPTDAAAGAAAGVALGWGAKKLGLDKPVTGSTVGKAAIEAEKLAEMREAIKEDIKRHPSATSWLSPDVEVPEQRGSFYTSLGGKIDGPTSGSQRTVVMGRGTMLGNSANTGNEVPVDPRTGQQFLGKARDSQIILTGDAQDAQSDRLKSEADIEKKTARLADAEEKAKIQKFKLDRAMKSDSVPLIGKASNLARSMPVQGVSGAAATLAFENAKLAWDAGDRSKAVRDALTGTGAAMMLFPHKVVKLLGTGLTALGGGLGYLSGDYDKKK